MDDNHTDKDFEKKDEKLENEEIEIYHPVKFSRSASNSVLSGICGGLGEYLHTEPNLIRIIFVLVTLLGGWGIALYIAVTLLIPLIPADDEFTEEEIGIIKNADLKTIAGTIFILLGIYFILKPTGLFYLLGNFNLQAHYLIVVAIIGLGIYFIKAKEPILKTQENLSTEFTRSKSDRRFMGVCGGLAKYLNVETTLLRVVWVISLFITAGISLVIYFIFALIVSFEKDLNADEI